MRISLNRGTPFRKACLKGGAGAVPAGRVMHPRTRAVSGYRWTEMDDDGL